MVLDESSNLSITWELVRNADFWGLSRATESQTLDEGPSDLL